jgi:hypothetical protein
MSQTSDEPRRPDGDSPVTQVEHVFRRADCEHVAALLKSAEELPPVIASFLSLGAARNGWLVHGSLPGQASADEILLAGAGLDVPGLTARGQLEIMELDLSVTPEEWVQPWSEMLEDRIDAGFDALWFTRFPVYGNDEEIAGVLPFEEAWMGCFKGRRVVTLCPYILTGLSPDTRAGYRQGIGSVHDRVVDLEGAVSSA